MDDKAARAAYYHDYYVKHREKIAVYKKKYGLEHREQKREYDAAYRAAGADGYHAKQKAWRLAGLGKHPDRYRESNLRRYGTTIAEHDSLVVWQDGKCAVCQTRAKLVVDHNHRLANKTEALRGLLCDPCNKGLGYFVDNPERLRAAADYIEGGT